MLWQDLFQSGQLLLPEHPSAAVAPPEAVPPLLSVILLLVFLLLFIFQLKNFISLVPYLLDSVSRLRGCVIVESSVSISRDRNILALVFCIPAVLIMDRYRLYNPSFLQDLSPNYYLLSQALVLLVFFLLRHLLDFLLRPRRRLDYYQLSRRTGYSYFIVLVILLAVLQGVLSLFPVNDLTVKWFIGIGALFVYLLYLLRRAQIFRLFCNPFRTFSYLCALEFLPTALLLVSAVVL